MEWINHLFGSGEHLNWIQMSSRAAVSFFFALVLLRIAGMRTFGRKSAFDNVILIILGAVLSLYNDFIGRLIKGEHQCLYAKAGSGGII